MKKLSFCFWILAILLSDIMCAVVAWNYCDMLWGIKYAGYSAPASAALLLAISCLFACRFHPPTSLCKNPGKLETPI